MKSSDPRPTLTLYVIWVASVAALTVGLFVRWLTSKKLGLLTLVGTAYVLLPRLTAFTPWPMERVLEWAVALPPEIILGVVGFFSAYWIAVNTWQGQKRLEIKLAVASEVDSFFQAAADDALKFDIFAGRLLSIKNAMDRGDSSNALPDTTHALQMLQAAMVSRAALSARAVDVNVLRGKHELVLSSGPMADQAFTLASKALLKIAEAMWYGVHDVVRSQEDLARMVAGIDRAALENFMTVVSKERPKMMMGAGAIRGLFQGAILQPSMYSAFRFYVLSRQRLHQPND